MTQTIEGEAPARNIFGVPSPDELFAGVSDAEGEDRALLRAIADRIAGARRPGAKSDIPAGVTYLTQFVVHDLDFPTRDSEPGHRLLDLGLIYGDGPKHHAFCYQVPGTAGAGRHLLRIGRARPTAASPAWGAARDLPRSSCPHLDARPVESRSEVLVPNSFSDSNMMLGQTQVLWSLLHNAAATVLGEHRRPDDAFRLARRVVLGVYRDVILADVLGSWLMPEILGRYTGAVPARVSAEPMVRTPREFVAGVGRLGHGLVREIYSLNDQNDVAGLRSLVRHTSTGRPHDMPLTEDWLLDFSRFFAIGSSVPQRARAIGPHIARPFANGMGVGTDGSADSLVLRDLVACVTSGLRSVKSLIEHARPALPEGSFALDEARWTGALAAWLAEAKVPVEGDKTRPMTDEEVRRLSEDPPLTLFLMMEADTDTKGKTLGALGSVLMGETLVAALPDVDDAPEVVAARVAVFKGPTPGWMAELIPYLQRHYRFAEGARLHPSDDAAPDRAAASSFNRGVDKMLDVQSVPKPAIPRIEVADYIEMGRLVAQWATDPATQPKDVAELKEQLDGIATVPDRIKTVEFVQSTLDHLVLRLPVREMIEESIDRMSDPMGDGRYPLPQFYADFYRPGFGPVMTPLDTLLARVGDYTIAQCR